MGNYEKTTKTLCLLELQRCFVAALVSEEPYLVKIHHAGTLEDGLSVYKEGYEARLLESLQEQYPKTNQFLGDEMFMDIGLMYIRQHPSTFYSLSDYGQSFWNFLKIQSAAMSQFPFISELARFEHCFLKLFHKVQHPSVAYAEFDRIGNKNCRFVFGGAVCLFDSSYSVYNVWKDCNDSLSLISVKWDHPIYSVLYKKEKRVLIMELPRHEYILLQSLYDGIQTFSLLEVFCEKNQIPEEAISSVFYRVVKEGWVERVEFV